MRVWNIVGPDPEWFSKADVCAALDVSERTLERLINEGYFPPGFRTAKGGKLRWSGLDIACYLHLLGRGAKQAGDATGENLRDETTS